MFFHIIYKNEVYDKGLISIEIKKDIKLNFIENVKNYLLSASKSSI